MVFISKYLTENNDKVLKNQINNIYCFEIRDSLFKTPPANTRCN